MRAPVPLRRAAYRTGYRALQLVWLLTHPHINGVKCLLTDVDRVLLVRHTYGGRSWDLPGGAIARGEPPVHAAAREMGEELSLPDGEWEPIGTLEVRADGRRDTLHCFRREIGPAPLSIDRGELLEARWFARAELPADLAPHVIPIVAQTTVRR